MNHTVVQMVRFRFFHLLHIIKTVIEATAQVIMASSRKSLSVILGRKSEKAGTWATCAQKYILVYGSHTSETCSATCVWGHVARHVPQHVPKCMTGFRDCRPRPLIRISVCGGSMFRPSQVWSTSGAPSSFPLNGQPDSATVIASGP